MSLDAQASRCGNSRVTLMAKRWGKTEPRTSSSRWAVCGLLVTLIVAGCHGTDQATNPAEDSPTSTVTITIRIGCQKSSLLLNLLRSNGELQERLGPKVRIESREFPAGPQMLEAMNVGGVDFGHAGETPPIFAQAAGVPMATRPVKMRAPPPRLCSSRRIPRFAKLRIEGKAGRARTKVPTCRIFSSAPWSEQA